MKRISALVALAATVAVVTGCSSLVPKTPEADTYPQSSIETVIPYAAGGSTDVLGRAMIEALSEEIDGAKFIPINVQGGSGGVGMTQVADAAPDGYTLGFTGTAAVAAQPLFGDVPYDLDSFEPIALVAASPNLLVVRADSPFQTFEDWQAYVKDNPGKFTYSSPGPRAVGRIAMEALLLEIGTSATNIPFDGNAPALTALLGGQVEGAVMQSVDVEGQIGDGGKYRVLLNLGTVAGSPELEKVPFATDKGLDVAIDAGWGMFAPAGTPSDVVDKLAAALESAVKSTRMTDAMAQFALTPDFEGPEGFREYLKQMNSALGKVVENADL